MSQPQRLVLIVGLDHSGTTIMDLALGASPSAIGIGEALRISDGSSNVSAMKAIKAKMRSEVLCSCGNMVDNCPLWSEIDFSSLNKEKIFPLFGDICSSAANLKAGATIVESSPNGWRYLNQLLEKYDVKILNIVRDVRSWSYSRRVRLKKSYSSCYWAWFRRNNELRKAIRTFPVPIMTVGYEEFALRPNSTLRYICEWADILYNEKMLHPIKNSSSHIIVGNGAAHNPQLVDEIRYDASWISDRSNNAVRGMLYTLLSRKNEDLVYSNNVLRRRS